MVKVCDLLNIKLCRSTKGNNAVKDHWQCLMEVVCEWLDEIGIF